MKPIRPQNLFYSALILYGASAMGCGSAPERAEGIRYWKPSPPDAVQPSENGNTPGLQQRIEDQEKEQEQKPKEPKRNQTPKESEKGSLVQV